MANTSTDTGHGASVAFTIYSNLDDMDYTSFQLGEESTPDIDTTHLATSNYRTYLPGDLAEPGEITLTFNFDNDRGASTNTTDDHQPPIMGATDTITITYPVHSSQQTAANFAGTGYFKSYTRNSLETDTLQTATIVFKLDGQGTDPTFTGGIPS